MLNLCRNKFFSFFFVFYEVSKSFTSKKIHHPKTKQNKTKQNMRNKLTKSPRSPRNAQSLEPISLHQMLADGWSNPICNGNFADIVRLIRRVEIRNHAGVVHARSPADAEPSAAKVLVHAVECVMEHFGEEAQMIEQMKALADNEYDEQLQLAQAVFAIVGSDSKTARIFKQIHQGVVLAGMDRLKATVLRDQLTKDVRSADGWVVDVWLHKDRCEVKHIRKEQSVDFQSPQSYWKLSWELSQSFDGDMNAMTAAFLRVLGVDLNQYGGDPAALSTELRCHGLIVE
jgi:hypothetical protein